VAQDWGKLIASVLMTRIPKFVAWISGHEQAVLIGWLLIVAGTWGFWEVSSLVAGGETQAFDERVVRLFRHPTHPEDTIGPRWLAQAAREITALGSYSALLLIIAISALFLAAAEQRIALRTLLGASFTGYALMLLLKHSFERPRPTVVPHLTDFHSSSFPSGHALMSVVIYVTLGFQLLRIIDHQRLRVAIIVTVVLLTTLIGVSRVFLGVHFPTDVLAGWTAGLVWSLVWLIGARRWQKRHDLAQRSSP
jgi:undecaprenyl-diphosphatase